MSAISASLLTLARKVNNYEADATGGTLWTATTTFVVTVPTGKRWFIIGGFIERDVSSTISVQCFDDADKVILNLGVGAAALGGFAYPSQASSVNNQQMPHMAVLDPGEYVQATFGTAQGVGAYGSCVVLEVDV